MSKTNFVKDVERLIDPISVGTLHFMQSFNQLLPKRIQKAIVKSSSKQTPYMGFVVEPYSLFLCHEIIDLHRLSLCSPAALSLSKREYLRTMSPNTTVSLAAYVHTPAHFGAVEPSYTSLPRTKRLVCSAGL
jgi:hypothetical protein